MLRPWIAGRVESRLRRLTEGFLGERNGTSAVEFALICPVLVLMLGASVELSGAITAGNRATYVAETIAQVVSQSQRSVTTAEMQGYIKAAALVDPDIVAYAKATGKPLEAAAHVAVSGVRFTERDAACKTNCAFRGDVVFSEALAGPKRGCGEVSPGTGHSMASLPTELFQSGSIVVVDVEVFYRPLMNTILGDEISYRRQAYFRPRVVELVNYERNCPGFPVT